jgi:hypothetical protein
LPLLFLKVKVLVFWVLTGPFIMVPSLRKRYAAVNGSERRKRNVRATNIAVNVLCMKVIPKK